MTNPDDASISIFSILGSDQIIRTAKVETGDQPVAVLIHPDNTTAFVANRSAATIVKVSAINTAAPAVSGSVSVGSEPTGLALSPTGRKLVVAEWAEGRVSVIDTATMNVLDVINSPNNPRAVAVTNNGDADDDDETVVVTEFFGEANPDTTGCPSGNSEVCDTGRIGRVRLYNLSDLAPQTPILFSPIDSGFADPSGTGTLMTAPNQLYSVAVQSGKVYVTSVSASPQPLIRFNANVFPVVYVGDLTTHTEDRSNVGTANLARLAENAVPDLPGTDRFFLGEPVDLDFDGTSNVAYVVSRAADVVQRVVFDPATGTTIGTDAVKQINVGNGGCQNPTGIVVAHNSSRAYVNCWITRRLGVLDLSAQTLEKTVQSSDLPAVGTQADAVRKGARFYFTGRGRWSDEGEGYSSCGSCHPDGLTDNMTWSFAAGPRQTTSMDGSFSHGAGPQKQRILNWTAIFDELHDFERNTRGVSGGLGAITTSSTNQCGTVTAEQPVSIPADGLGQPIKEIQDTAPGICVKDWDDINEFVKTIRPPRGRRSLDSESVARGAAIFANADGSSSAGACATCHGGPGWTVSRRFFTPSSNTNATLKTTSFVPPTNDAFWPMNTTQISTQPASADAASGTAIAPNEVTCVLRNVGTFGFPDDAEATNALEKKADASGSRAQGRGGFNVPSLYGLSVGAPYFHHGQARTLDDLFEDPRWRAHITAANPNFAPTDDEDEDLINFLLSIDATTPEIALPAGFDACPSELQITLSGQEEAPQPVTTAGSGSATVIVTATEIDVTLTTQGMTDLFGAHIHVGPPGVNGPIIFVLHSNDTDGPFPPTLTKKLTAADLLPQPDLGINSFADAVSAILAGKAYMNVHTAANPGGEIRAQMAATVLQAQLSGDNQPDPVDTAASGTASLGLAATTITVTINTQGLSGALAAHIHVGQPGVNGPVIFPLYSNDVDGPLPESFTRTVTAADLLPAPEAGIVTFDDALNAIRNGGTYVNVHTGAHPGGEIRGQVGVTEVHTALSGQNEPDPVTTAANGRGSLGIRPSAITVTLNTQGLTDALAAHIHAGPPGINGPVIFALYSADSDGPLPSPFTKTLTSVDLLPDADAGILTFDDALDAIRNGGAYLNIHTAANPGGEIRGQLNVTELHATLSGASEVDPVVTTATGRARIGLRSDALTVAITTDGLTDVLAGHIHVGPPGVNGPVIFPLYSADQGPFASPAVFAVSPAALLPAPAQGITTFADALTAIRNGEAYVNLHTVANPNGEIRGQIGP